MRSLFTKMMLSAVLIASATATAQAEQLRLGDPAYGGTGCPAGSASVTVSPDQQSLSVLFDNYLTEAGYTNGRQVDRKSCNFVIPVHVPQGYSIAVYQVDYRGFNALPSGARSRFSAESFFAGSRGPVMRRNFTGPVNNDFTLTDGILASNLVWAPCGSSVTLRVNSSMMTTTNSAFDQAISGIDSLDLSSGLIYHIQWRRCH
jgi:hypothetical protein